MSAKPSYMTLPEARRILQHGGEWVELAEAIGVVISDSSTSLQDIMLGLHHPGLVAEQAALALYKRTGEPLPENRQHLRLKPKEWAARLKVIEQRKA